MGLTAFIVVGGVKAGIEKWSVRLMPTLVILILALIVYVIGSDFCACNATYRTRIGCDRLGRLTQRNSRAISIEHKRESVLTTGQAIPGNFAAKQV